jgi:flagellar hook-basal body complex protein FliE
MTFNNFQAAAFRSAFPAMPQVPSPPQMPTLHGGITTGGGNSFGEVFAGMLGKVNKEMAASEELVHQAVVGKANLHDVMIQMAKEEVALGITTQAAGKFISTVEKLTQMQI